MVGPLGPVFKGKGTRLSIRSIPSVVAAFGSAEFVGRLRQVDHAHERGVAMRTFMLSVGLGLASLVGLAGAVHAQRPQPGPLPLPGGSNPAPTWDATVGHWNNPQAADAYGRQGVFDGIFASYRVVQGPDVFYYVQVVYFHN